MPRLIFVPQMSVNLRYQEWFPELFYIHLEKEFDDIKVLGSTVPYSSEKEMFAPINLSIEHEMQQIKEYMNMKIYDDDILFLADLSFPGFFCNALYHKPIKNAFAYCHATSKNYLDYFPRIKFSCETSHSMLFKKIFVGSQYHADKLGWDNVEVIGLPTPPFPTYKEEKIYDIISVCRPCPQKVDEKLEKEISKEFGEIVRKQCNTWEEYYKFLSQSKVLFISSFEDTFNYSALEAINNNCCVVAPERCSFPELLPKEFLYNKKTMAIEIIHSILDGELECPKELLNQELVDNFFKNLIKGIKEN